MQSEEILQQTTNALLRRARWVRRRTLLLHALFVGLCMCLALVIIDRFMRWPIDRLVEAGLACLGFCLLVAMLMGLRSRAQPLELLIRADRTLRLKERLSTAYELASSPDSHPLRGIVLQEGARVARSVNPFRVIPTTTPRILRWTPFLMLAMILVFVVDFGRLLPEGLVGGDHDSPHPAWYEKGQTLERLGQRLEAEARRHGLEHSLEAARRMQNVGLRLQNEKLNEREALARVNSLSDYVRNIEDELKKMAVLEDVSISKVREVMVNQTNVTSEVQRLLGMLARGNLSPSEMRNLQERLRNLGQQGVLDDRLNQALNQLQEGDLAGAKDLLENLLRQNQLAQDFEHLKRAERALDRGLERDAGHGEEMAGDQPGGQGRDDGSDQQLGDALGAEGSMPGDFEGGDYMDSEGPGVNSSVGTGRGKETETSRPHMTETNAPPTKITGQNGEGGVRQAYVRALPLKAEASVPLEDVISTYHRQAEESLLREEIPPENRDLVRTYFLSIGLVGESAGSDEKDEQHER